MKESEVVKKIAEKVKENPIKLYEDGSEKPEYSLNEGLVNKAFLKICEAWNKDEKSRSFIKHLAKSFIPVETLSKCESIGDPEHLAGKDRCCILGIKIAGTKEITGAYSEYNEVKLSIDKKVKADNRETYNERESKKLKGMMRHMPIEVRNMTIGYLSPKSNKMLSGEASKALCLFLEEGALNGDSDIMFLVSGEDKKPFAKKRSSRGHGMNNFVDNKTYDKLKNLRNSLSVK